MDFKYPYPSKIIFDIGDSYLTGLSLGTIFYFIKGLYISEKNNKIKGTIKLITNKAPSIGSNFASWNLIYNFSYYSLLKIRKRYDLFNPIFACFSTGALTNYSNGFKNCIKGGISGCFYLCFIEGVLYIIQKKQKQYQFNKENELIKKYNEFYKNQGLKLI